MWLKISETSVLKITVKTTCSQGKEAHHRQNTYYDCFHTEKSIQLNIPAVKAFTLSKVDYTVIKHIW